jgi:predicted transcriptional regulator
MGRIMTTNDRSKQPDQHKARKMVRLPDDLWNRLHRIATEQDRPLSRVLRQFVTEAADRYEEQQRRRGRKS